ncbi:MAG: prolyl oligopeptidase family serine peptidase [Pseudomonadota bacterium]
MRVIHAAAALAVLALAPDVSAQPAPDAHRGLTNYSVRPPAEPLHETTFGIALDDEYRWMENPARTAEMTAWVRASSEHTRAELAALPGRERLAQRLQNISRASVSYFDIRQAGGRLFFLRLDADAAVQKLYVREANGAERVLFDPAKVTGDPVSISNFTPSPSGQRIAFHLTRGGAEIGVMHFMNVATGQELPDQLTPMWSEFPVSWMDENTVIYTRMDPNSADTSQNMDLRLHHLGAAQASDTVLIASGEVVQHIEFPAGTASQVSPWIAGAALGARSSFRPLFARAADVRAGHPRWFALADYDDDIENNDIRGDYVYLISTKAQPNGEILRVDLRHPALANATTTLPASDLVLQGDIATRDGLYVSAMRDGISHLLFLANAEGAPREVVLPFDGTLNDFNINGDASGVTFQLQGWLQNSRSFQTRGGVLTPLGADTTTYAGASNFEVVNETATSADGTQVPLIILAPKGLARDHNNPTILTAYASYGISQTPAYSPFVFGWMEEHAVFAICAARGGGERGRSWHEGGRERNKPNGHADFIACAERLIALGYTDPAHLGATGVSAGGLLVPVAALKRPDLFAAVVPRVSILNPTRLAVANNGPNQYAEMGDPTTAEGFRALYEQDSYQWLTRATASPDWLLTIGLNDHRVEPWMSGKFVARALARFGDHHLVLMRTDPEAGHGVGSTRDQLVDERADYFSFFLNRFGAADFQSH